MTQLPAKAPFMFGAKKVAQDVRIQLPSGQYRQAEFLGRGKFSNVFRSEVDRDCVYIYTKHGDLSKDILSHVPRSNNRHIPLMVWLGSILNGTIDVYRSVYYVTPVNKCVLPASTWKVVLALRRAHAEACTAFPGNIIAKNQCIDFNYHIAENADVPEKIKEALVLITESAQDWGEHYLFDTFRGCNLGLDKSHRLIFLDPMFDAEMIQKGGGK